ncbi:MAG: hypothetical protein DRJ52_06750 [Thermoprotei archaeon]|nr:MAG: hypothetical protein DRJ52_06750 [Thermoprotei archaeon]RLF00071.1 MAG: hypothetical protein DRJ63_03515 [Thermoprotei archaeon]
MVRVKPVHALCFFSVSLLGDVNQLLVFDYYDPDLYYAKLVERKLIDYELETIASNMQDYLDEEKVLVNGRRVYPEVRHIDIAFRGTPKNPSIYFIIYFKGYLKPGENTYEDYYESERVEYDYEFYWIFPPGVQVKKVVIDGFYTINNNILSVYVERGSYVKGYEKIVFDIPQYLFKIPLSFNQNTQE